MSGGETPSDNSGGEFLLSLLHRPPSQPPQRFFSAPHQFFQQQQHHPNSTSVAPTFPNSPDVGSSLINRQNSPRDFNHLSNFNHLPHNLHFGSFRDDGFSRDNNGSEFLLNSLNTNSNANFDSDRNLGLFRNDGFSRDNNGSEVLLNSLNANSNANFGSNRNLGLFRNDGFSRDNNDSEVLLNSLNANSNANFDSDRNLGLFQNDVLRRDRSQVLPNSVNTNSGAMNTNVGNFSNRRGVSGRGKEHYVGAPPPGFQPRGGGGRGNWDHGNRRRELENNVSRGRGSHGEFGNNRNMNGQKERLRNGQGFSGMGIARQLDRPGPPAGMNLHSVSGLDVEESFVKLKVDGGDEGEDEVGEELVESLLLDEEADSNKDKKQIRQDYRSDSRGQRILSQRMRMIRSQMECRRDIDLWNAPFISIYDSLIPPEEEKAKQKQLLTLLETLINKEWPDARLYLYGSCASSFGVLKSDIDVCLAMEDADVNKVEILTKLADILQSDNLQNVQALTRARVPIVKLMDPVTGISCDICINNILAVVNTKLLRDYAQIDERLRQLAFIVKHWAKTRGVNETYQGTLSSYAYVLMCIHFLQQRRPAILPCLQEMESTYYVTVDDTECSFFDQVENLRGFGSSNRETIAQLVWAFFKYWAYRHDYLNDVISVRTGRIISKREKDWTRRIGNDRHLICIEDPFETSHDLGRVVDKFSIRVLREEFERAAEIMQYDPNPCATLFQPYVPI